MANHGYVYLLGNRAMPGIFKIGKTTGCPFKRAEMLSYGTGVPYPFTVMAWVECVDCDRIERHLHVAFEKHRINPRREFFRLSARELMFVWSCLHHLPHKLESGSCDEWGMLLESYVLPNCLDYDENEWDAEGSIRIEHVLDATASLIPAFGLA